MWNRQEMMSRIRECQRQGVPITNYGLVIAYGAGNPGAGARAVSRGAGGVHERGAEACRELSARHAAKRSGAGELT